MSGASSAFCEWAVRHLLHELRSGSPPAGLTPADINWAPMRQLFRAALRPDDATLVKRFLADEELVMWGAVMSDVFAGEEVDDALMRAFRAEGDPDRLLGLFHNASARRLDADMKAELHEWAAKHSGLLISNQREAYYGTGGRERLRAELSNPTLPEKRWVYMYAAHALETDEARRLLRQHHHDADPIVAEAARRSLSLLPLSVMISYRRKDSHISGRLHDALAARLGGERISRDVSSLEPGHDFHRALVKNIERSTVVLAVIGPGWEPERLRHRDDVVRMELGTALREDVLVVPLLVDDATMPSRTVLPEALVRLADLHAYRVRDDPYFHGDVDRLVAALDRAGSSTEP